MVAECGEKAGALPGDRSTFEVQKRAPGRAAVAPAHGREPSGAAHSRRRFRRALINVRNNQEEERRNPSANEGALG